MAEAYHDAILRRLGVISDIGTSATSSAIRRMQAQTEASARQNAGAMQNTMYGQPQVMPSGSFGSFLKAISGKESGNNYGAVNRHSGALGKYQIMPGNIPSWSREALGRSITPQQFLRDRSLQEQIAQHKLRQYYNKWGPEGAAVAWYAGPGRVNDYMKNGGRGYNRAQGQYPSISAYAHSILKSMGLR